MGDFFLSIDNGGTKTKVMVFDEKGKQVSCAAFPTACEEEKAGFREIDLAKLWESIGTAIQDAIKMARIDRSEVKAVACVGHGKGLYLLDKDQQIFYPGILSTDTRANSLAAELEKRNKEIFPVSCQHVVGSQAPVLLKWLKIHQPDVYQKIGSVLSAKDFVRSRLTGKIAAEYGDASGNNFLNLKTRAYDSSLFTFFDIMECWEKMPVLKSCEDICGDVTAEAAAMTGLQEGTPVIGGLFDLDACALATGVLDDDIFGITAGTWNINMYPAKECAAQTTGLMNSLFLKDKFLVEASSATSAGNLELMIQMLMEPEKEAAEKAGRSVYDSLEEMLSHTDAGYAKVFFFPFLYGSNVDLAARGSLIGMQSTTKKMELLRAVYEGIAFAHRYHIEQLIKARGARPKVLRISGGCTNSPSWVRMFADVSGIAVETVEAKELGGLGGAMAAAAGIGRYDSLIEASAKMTRVTRHYLPDSKQVRLYQEKYAVYLELLQALACSWKKLSSMQERMKHDEFLGNL